MPYIDTISTFFLTKLSHMLLKLFLENVQVQTEVASDTVGWTPTKTQNLIWVWDPVSDVRMPWICRHLMRLSEAGCNVLSQFWSQLLHLTSLTWIHRKMANLSLLYKRNGASQSPQIGLISVSSPTNLKAVPNWTIAWGLILRTSYHI